VELFTNGVLGTALETTTAEKGRINEVLRELLGRVEAMGEDWAQRN
jgi:hypothetical protein